MAALLRKRPSASNGRGLSALRLPQTANQRPGKTLVDPHPRLGLERAWTVPGVCRLESFGDGLAGQKSSQVRAPDNKSSRPQFRIAQSHIIAYLRLFAFASVAYLYASTNIESSPQASRRRCRSAGREPLVDINLPIENHHILSPGMIEQTPFVIARDLAEVNDILKSLTRREDCVKCDDSSKLTCPACGPSESCQFTVPLNCKQCAKSFCTKEDASPLVPSSDNGGSSGPNVGGIAGGVVGAIIAIAMITYLIWRFVIKPKRAADSDQSVYETESNLARHVEKDDASRMTRRSSTHTVHSIASTVLTRASNIIQIAYIPGVTNRASPTSPSVLVPPVPPIPMRHSESSRGSGLTAGDQHFFVPGNLRDSTFSGISSFSDRTSYAPRSSIASTIYGKQAQVQIPAQTGMRAKPTVVSVKSVATSAPNTPPVPSINFEKVYSPSRPDSTASTFSVGSTYLNNANTAKQGRAQVVKLGGSGLKKVDIVGRSDASASSSSLVSSSSKSSSEDSATASKASSADQGPFSDPPLERKTGGTCSSTPTLVSVAEEVEERRGAEKSKRPGSGDRERSPFGDEHATKE
ncbi:hypothetical protein E4U21_007101 [Claviceps maximensis]|nr:hypothetical protein E4U21_007101 [Claviceps maximensis]